MKIDNKRDYSTIVLRDSCIHNNYCVIRSNKGRFKYAHVNTLIHRKIILVFEL